MPSRIIREGILGSDRVNRLSLEAELFYRRLMSVVDDFGRFDGRPVLLRTSCYRLRVDTVSEADILRYLAECEENELIRMYAMNGSQHSFPIKVAEVPELAGRKATSLFLEYLNFRQKTRAKESKFPAPPPHDPSGGSDPAPHSPCICPAYARHMQGTGAASAVPLHPEADAEANPKTETLSGGAEATPPPPMTTGCKGTGQPTTGASRKPFKGKPEPSPERLDADYGALVPPMIESYEDLCMITDPVFMAMAITRDREPQSWRGWVKLASALRKQLGRVEADRRWFSECERFWGETNSKEFPRNMGAALTSRLNTLRGAP